MKWLNYQLPNKAIKAESLQMQALYSRKNDYRKIYLNPYSVGYWVAPNSPAQLLQELSTLPNSKGFKNPKNLTSKEWRNLQLTNWVNTSESNCDVVYCKQVVNHGCLLSLPTARGLELDDLKGFFQLKPCYDYLFATSLLWLLCKQQVFC